jgi:hypothetical protein
MLKNSDVVTGIVIGWIEHPGGGVPLDTKFITQAPRFVDDDYTLIAAQLQPIELLPPLQRSVVTSSGSNLTFTSVEFDATNYVVAQRVENSPTAVPAVQQLVQNIGIFVQNNQRLQSITVYSNFASTPLTKLLIEVFDTTQAPVTVTAGTVTGMGTWSSATATVDHTTGTFTDGKPYTVRLTHEVNKGEYIQLGRVVLSFWPYPV